MNKTKKIYISTPLKPSKFNLSLIQKEILAHNVFAFIPPTEEKNDSRTGSAVDKLMIELCDEVWAFGPLGRDCTWEIGYAQGLGKPVVLYLDSTNKYLDDEDWMVFCAGTIKKWIY